MKRFLTPNTVRIGALLVLWIAVSVGVDIAVQTFALVNNVRLNSEVVYAVCVRFSHDEEIDLMETLQLSKKISDRQTAKILADAYVAKKKQFINNCPNAMLRAERNSRKFSLLK